MRVVCTGIIRDIRVSESLCKTVKVIEYVLESKHNINSGLGFIE